MSETEKTGPVCKVCGRPVSGAKSRCDTCQNDDGLIRLIPSLYFGLSPSLVLLIALLPSKGVNEEVGPLLLISFLMIPFAGYLASRGIHGFGRRLALFVVCSGGYVLLNFMLFLGICAVRRPQFFVG